MSTPYSIAQRTPLLNTVFAGLACAATLALAAGPALAEPAGLERVKVQGRVVEAPVRYDVTAACARIETQLQDALQTTWMQSRPTGEVAVQLVMQGDDIDSVSATGLGHAVERSVRKAVRSLKCGPQDTTTAQVFRFQIAFTEADAGPNAMAAAQNGLRVALMKR